MSTLKPSEPMPPAAPAEDGAAASSTPAAAGAPTGESTWDGDNTDSVPAVDGLLENPMWSEKTAIAPSTPPPAPHAPFEATLAPGAIEAPSASLAPTMAPAAASPRPIAATMAGPVALAGAGASAEAVPVTVGGKSIPPGARAGEPPADSYVGAVIADRYRVIKKLGEGGMGTVYLAEHIIIEKKVALKVLSEDFARKADLVQRFMQEAKAASRIGHENIVDITDFGETPSGSVFIAMEFLEGSDLANVIRTSGALPFERARYVVTQICRALGAAHAKGIIHRDMKPENVFLVEREGRPDFVKILDFGIAKVSSLDEGGSRLTRTGMIFGTPEYMSPEQARGDRPDHRVDIYAVGCILYELLTGDVPFHADTFMGVLTKHMFEQPQPLSLKAPDKNIPPEVESVVLRAIAKDREQRFQSMKEFSMALAACGGGYVEAWGNEPSGVQELPAPAARSTAASRAVSPTPTGATPRTTTPAPVAAPEPQSGRGLWIAGAVLGVLALGGVGFMALRTQRGAPRPPVTAPVDNPPPAAPVGATVAPVPTTTPVAPAPSEATISINSTPAGAEVVRDHEVLGTTPLSLRLPIGSAPIGIQLRKRDFKDREVEIVPDKDRSYEFDLIAARKASSRPTAKLPTVAPEPPAVAPAPGPGPRPAGRLRDLKDPFSDEPAKKK